MDYRVRWSSEAVEDLTAIAEYISRDSSFYAQSVVRSVLSTTQGLATHPRIGRIVPELSDESIRERFVHSYRIIYRLESGRILIVAIIHGKRLADELKARTGSKE
jgi:plasmid stabilization system protein ParE